MTPNQVNEEFRRIVKQEWPEATVRLEVCGHRAIWLQPSGDSTHFVCGHPDCMPRGRL